jgi:hypothetical protein
VRAGRDLVLLGVAEQGVVPIRTYSEDEARAAGLIDEDGLLILPAEEVAPLRTRRPALRLPQLALPRLALPAPAKPARPKPALPASRNALDQLRAWTVRG